MLPLPKVIFEDNQILVIDKPYGWVVNSAETTADTETVQDWIEKNWDFFSSGDDQNFHWRRGIVHRLDKETSGILLVGKTVNSFLNLQSQFKERKVKKKYLALVHGKLEPEEGIIDFPISRNPFNREKFGVFLGGRKSVTKYSVIEYLRLKSKPDGEYYSLVEARPKTGRTHQIRVHFKQIGHPVFADEKYGGRKTSRTDRKICPRQFLHAASISFFHPDGDSIGFTAELPDDLKIALNFFIKQD